MGGVLVVWLHLTMTVTMAAWTDNGVIRDHGLVVTDAVVRAEWPTGRPERDPRGVE